MKSIIGNIKMKKNHCIPIRLYLWTLKFEFHIFFMWHGILYFWFTGHNITDGCWIWPMGRSFLIPVLKHVFFRSFFNQALIMLSWARYFAVCSKGIREKEMATHSSTLAWRIPWMEEPGGLQFMGLQRVRHDWATSLSKGIKRQSVEEKEGNLHGNY